MSEPIDNKALQTLVEDAADKLLAIAAECLRRGVETDATLARAERAEALLKEAVEALRQGDTAMEEAEAILGGEYDVHHQFLCDSIMLFRATLAHIQETKP